MKHREKRRDTKTERDRHTYRQTDRQGEKEREDHRQPDEHWYCFRGNAGQTFVIMGFPESLDK